MEFTETESSTSKRPTEFCGLQTKEKSELSSEGNSSLKEDRCKKRMKKDDSGINVVAESDDSSDDSCDESNPDNQSEKEKCDTVDSKVQLEHSSPDSGNLEFSNLSMDSDNLEKKNSIALADKCNEDDDSQNRPVDQVEKVNVDSDPEGTSDDQPRKDPMSNYDPTPNNPKPQHLWNPLYAVTRRQNGISSNFSPDLFRHSCYGSLHMVERLELMYKMKKHDGCVNTLHFNSKGTKLVTGSDDLNIIIWDWTLSEPKFEYSSGHRSNVFQAKFLPLSGDCNIVTCARDGQVRLGELMPSGSTAKACTKKLAQHKGAAHKLSTRFDSPHTFLSCGEDAVVFELDVRKEKPEKLVVCRVNDKRVPLYSICCNPMKGYEYVVGGRDHFVRVYDTRFTGQEEGYLKKYCPLHLAVNNPHKANVTSVVYSYNGLEILASYNDEDIYIFDSKETDTSLFSHRYRGHRNSQTVKGVNFFGSKSEYIVSGSDCGHIFFWEKESEHIVKYMYGDEGGVVNCLEPHPNMPVLATSGLDDDVKIWVPSCEEMPNLCNLRNHICNNMKEREDDRKLVCADAIDDQMIWFLMQHLRRARRRQLQGQPGTDHAVSNSSSSDASSDSEGHDGPEPQSDIQCNQS